mgnify:CR=1|jgi:hypothetical protein
MTQQKKTKSILLFYFLLTETWYTLSIVKKYFNQKNIINLILKY